MLSLEEYISRRKEKDGINEFDSEKRIDNLKRSVNYVIDYYHEYLNQKDNPTKPLLENEKVKKFRKQMKVYSPDIQEWLTDIYSKHSRHINRSIDNILKQDPLFFLYHEEKEFKTAASHCYSELIESRPFIANQNEMIYLFIKEHHYLESKKAQTMSVTLEIDNWVEDTWGNYGVQIWAFVQDYLNDFYDEKVSEPDLYENSKRNSQLKMRTYNIKEKNNLFDIDRLFSQLTNKPFMKGKKKQLEVMFMYYWLHDLVGDEDNYWEKYFEEYLESNES